MAKPVAKRSIFQMGSGMANASQARIMGRSVVGNHQVGVDIWRAAAVSPKPHCIAATKVRIRAPN